jgi:multiple sugar transport system substrate-binding protein
MKQMRLLFLIMVCFTMVIAGCNSKSTQEEPKNEEKPKEAVKNEPAKEEQKPEEKPSFALEWMAHPAYSLQSSDPKRVEYLKDSIKQFEQAHPGITINGSTLPQEGMAKLLEQASQGRAPDVAQLEGFMLPRFHQYLQPLDPYLDKFGIRLDDFFPFIQNVMKGPDGKIYGIQFTTDTRVLYYRTDLVPTPPKTWDEVLQTGKELKDKGIDAFLFAGGRGEATSVTAVLPFFWAQGGKLVDEQGKPVFATGENKQYMLNVLNFIKQSVDAGITPSRVANYKNETDMNADVATGKVAMFLGGNWQVNQLKDILGDDFKKWAVAPIPQMKADTHTTTAGGWAWGVFTKDPAKQEAAMDFLFQTFIGDKGMASWSNIGGYLPTRKSVYDFAEYQSNDLTKTFREHLDKYAKARPFAEIYPNISTELQIAVSSVVAGSQTPEKALDDAWKAVNQ